MTFAAIFYIKQSMVDSIIHSMKKKCLIIGEFFFIFIGTNLKALMYESNSLRCDAVKDLADWRRILKSEKKKKS
jgi:hypothetical protein